MNDPKTFTLHNGEQEVNFTGHLLGEASSFSRGKDRWAEITIYKTVGGNYVVAGIGRTTVPGEDDRPWVQVCEEPQGVIDRLHMLDHERSRYIPHTSMKALTQARKVDTELDHTFMRQSVA